MAIVSSTTKKPTTPYVSAGLTRNAQGGIVKRPPTAIPTTQPKTSIGTRLGNNLAPTNVDPTEARLRAAMNTQAKGTDAYFQNRAALNDYLKSKGQNTNVRAGEANYTGKSQYAPPMVTPSGGSGDTPPGDTPPGDTPPPPPSPDPIDPFKSVYEFALKNFQDSPLYKFQKEELNSELNKRLAAQGYLGSGAELEAARKANESLGAQWTDRILTQANTDATRYDQQQQQAAEAKQQTQIARSNNALSLLNSLLSQNPSAAANAGLGDLSSLQKMIADIQSGTTRSDFTTVQPGITTAKGGGGAAPTRTIVPSSGPDTSSIDIARLLSGNSDNSSFINLAQSVLSSLL